MAKECSTCTHYIYEYGMEDNDEYCNKGIDINTIPEPEEDPCFVCKEYNSK